MRPVSCGCRKKKLYGFEGGAIDYIKKPFSIEELEKKIKSIIALRNKMKRHQIINIRKGIDNLLSNIEVEKNWKPVETFNSICDSYGLSVREKEVLKLLPEGLLNKIQSDPAHFTDSDSGICHAYYYVRSSNHSVSAESIKARKPD
jgi:response regulator RpfG family c-di-GMP phosphodiesterase